MTPNHCSIHKSAYNSFGRLKILKYCSAGACKPRDHFYITVLTYMFIFAADYAFFQEKPAFLDRVSHKACHV